MESARAPTPPPKFGSVARTVTKILRFRRNAASSAGVTGVVVDEDDSIHKLKLSQNLGEYYAAVLSGPPGGDDFLKVEHEKPQKKGASTKDKEAVESLLANLFASISAIKASYAQVQIAQTPYDPESIQKADLAIVSELKRISEIKQSYFKKQFMPHFTVDSPPAAFSAQLEEQRNLIKTYKITSSKLETDLKHKDAEILSLEAELLESEKKNRSLEAKLHPSRSLSALDDLHLSGLNPTHFLTALRYTYKSIRYFVKLMVKEMESAGWDLDAAAAAIQPEVLLRKNPVHRTFAFESYVCGKMFSDFHNKSFNLSSLGDRLAWGRQQFFKEFSELQSASAAAKLKHSSKLSASTAALAKFFQVKYLSLVHPKMESSFFGDLDQMVTVSSGRGFPDSEFFAGFAEMARSVWLLHCLFFSFQPESESEHSIFQARRGSRFSEVYMESVADDDGEPDGLRPDTVGYTVVPGFRVGRMLIQCKVYLSSTAAIDSRRS